MYFDLISCFANGCVCVWVCVGVYVGVGVCVLVCVYVGVVYACPHIVTHIVTVPPESKLLQSRTHVYTV